MIISDFIKLSTRPTLTPDDYGTWLGRYQRSMALRGAAKLLSGDMAGGSQLRLNLASRLDELDDAVDGERHDAFTALGSLPIEMTPASDDPTHRAALWRAICASPTVQLDEVRRIADVLGFIVMPAEYLHDESCKAESLMTERSVRGFVESLQGRMNVYVLAPVGYYDIWKHIRSKSDWPIYAGKPVSQAFLAIAMSVPVFRTLHAEGKAAKKRTEKVEREVSNLVKRMTALERQVEQELRAAMRARAEAEQTARDEAARRRSAELAAAASMTRFVAQEPMLIAFAQDKTIDDAALAIVGPCWGPDFEDIVAAGLGFTAVEGQREKLYEASKLYGGKDYGNPHQDFDQSGWPKVGSRLIFDFPPRGLR